MRGYLTANDIANNTRMLRSQFKGSFLIVEGDTDARVYKNFVDETECKVIVAHNKDNATQALGKLELDQFAGVLAVVDADFSRIYGVESASEHLFFTDFHDLETMIFTSPALEKVLREFGSDAKVESFFAKHGIDIRTALLKNAAIIGILRLISLTEALHLKFEGITFSDFVDRDSLAIDLQKLIQSVKNNSQMPHLEITTLLEKIQQIRNDGHDHRELCCGHDLTQLLSVALRHAVGTMKAGDAKAEILERSLRLAYDYLCFRSTRLHASLQDWETRQHGAFRVFANVG